MSEEIKIELQYFAVLRDQAGKRNEEYTTRAQDPAALFEELKKAYGFKLCFGDLKVAINGDFVDAEARLKAGDQVVFIPPVAGG